jgi:hypothetical protein
MMYFSYTSPITRPFQLDPTPFAFAWSPWQALNNDFVLKGEQWRQIVENSLCFFRGGQNTSC